VNCLSLQATARLNHAHGAPQSAAGDGVSAAVTHMLDKIATELGLDSSARPCFHAQNNKL